MLNLNIETYNYGYYLKGSLDLSGSDLKKAEQVIADIAKTESSVRGGRKKIKKGSKEFEALLQESGVLSRLYNTINSLEFTHYVLSLLKIDEKRLEEYRKYNFDSTYKVENTIMDKLIRKLRFRKKIFWEVDFSCSNGGYARRPHLDSPNRLVAILVYFNDVSASSGGRFEFYGQPLYIEPNRDCIVSEQKILVSPTSGLVLGFQSNEKSAHAAQEFTPKEGERRVFAYFGLSLEHTVSW